MVLSLLEESPYYLKEYVTVTWKNIEINTSKVWGTLKLSKLIVIIFVKALSPNDCVESSQLHGYRFIVRLEMRC